MPPVLSCVLAFVRWQERGVIWQEKRKNARFVLMFQGLPDCPQNVQKNEDFQGSDGSTRISLKNP
jgi:hypothetical protein